MERPSPKWRAIISRASADAGTRLADPGRHALHLGDAARAHVLETKDMEEGHLECERLLDVAAEVIAQFLQSPNTAQDFGRR